MYIKRTLAILIAVSGLALGTWAQTGKAPAAGTGTSNAAPVAGLPTAAQVNAFLHRFFGFDPNVVAKVVDIKPSPMRGLAEVDVLMSTPKGQRPLTMYVSSQDPYALVGQIIPFGPDPFAKDRAVLDKGVFGPTKGASTPAITIVEFGDLQCPACKQAQPAIEKLMSEEPKVRLVFQNFPLPSHPWAEKAAAYLDCVGRQNNDAAWKFTSEAYAQQDAINQQEQAGAAALTAKLNEIATASGVDAGKVAACADSAETKSRLQRSLKLGETVDVTSTPFLFINGRGVGNAPYDMLKAMVDFEIAETSGGGASTGGK